MIRLPCTIIQLILMTDNFHQRFKALNSAHNFCTQNRIHVRGNGDLRILMHLDHFPVITGFSNQADLMHKPT
ncbi:Uncharacterised protein [Vibrio cholerae]|nr:Uncharacterised protein [Vibrio cholerae]